MLSPHFRENYIKNGKSAGRGVGVGAEARLGTKIWKEIRWKNE